MSSAERANKGIIRFNEKDRQEVKTEYLVIGTLVSMKIFPEKEDLIVDAVPPILTIVPARAFDIVVIDLIIQ